MLRVRRCPVRSTVGPFAAVFFGCASALAQHNEASAVSVRHRLTDATAPGDVTSEPQAESRYSDRPGPNDVARRPSRRLWYGWETLIVDGASLALFLGTEFGDRKKSEAISSSPGIYVGTIIYSLGAPAVHATRGHWGKSAASVALRAGSMLILIWSIVQCLHENTQNENYGCPSNPVFWFGVLSVPAAVAIDAAVIAHEDVPLDEARLQLAPWIDAKGGRGGVILNGAF